ncbi:ATP-binding protein [Chroococcidiopsis sp. CCMEE 29]|uniref:PAS domain-containing sensor histidine kinase n=1 Tax=Chroococcidiopsis sp. CCMEE 29 TaxID=155894 RepID=UPI00201FCC77|nr:ATP-binding protein [Chroococcidiopsis sp. CCMEE 29]
MNKFVQKVDTVRQRLYALQQGVSNSSLPQPGVMPPEGLEELQVALEELQVAQEELKAQNEELVIARAQVEAERQRYHDLFEFAPDGYLVTDNTGIIREANRTAAILLNVSRQYLLGKPLINFIPYEERRIFRAKLTQLHQIDWMQEWEIHLQPRDSEVFDAALTISTVRDWQGNSAGWRWLLRDVTARKQAEEKIRNIQLQNLQLQEAARLKSQFLAIMSHELRSPMNAIIGFSQLLLRQPQPLAKSQESMVERILNSGKHLLKLIEDVLDFSKLEVGQLQLQLEELNLAELVTTTTEQLYSLVEQKSLAFQVNLNLQNPYIVNDSDRLRQVLVNLLSNAIKFTDSGSVQVDVWELPSNGIALAVKDTGIGIAEADIEQIFLEFQQVNQTLTRKHGGTGLGLAIVDRLVRMMQGNISVESQLGEGSTFRIELPRQVRGEGL